MSQEPDARMSHVPAANASHAPPHWPSAARATFARCLRVLRLAAPIVPARQRDEWKAEWIAELWHRIAALDQAGMLDSRARRDVFVQTLGALPHAIWLRRAEWSLDMLLQDLKYAARVNWKRPAFSLLVIAILGVGIGANSAMFSIVNAVLIEPLPYDDAPQLVHAYGAFALGDHAAISPADFLHYRAQNDVFSSLAAYTIFGTSILSGTGEPERVNAPLVSANFFSTLGVRPLLGRSFLPSEENGEQHVVILSYGLWQRRFGGDPRIVGTKITVDGEPSTVVGVMPPVLERTFTHQLWRPVPFRAPESELNPRSHTLFAIGRLRRGTTVQQAQLELDVIAKQLAAAYPADKGWHLHLVPYRDVVVGGAGPVLILLLGAVGFVLLIACGNVASLMLARGTARESEIAVRTALGASRMALVRQLLTESLLLGTAAGGIGLLLAFLLVRAVRAVAGGILPRVAEVRIDGMAIVFTLAITLLTAVLFGLAPALHAARGDLAPGLRSSGRASNARRTRRLRDVLVVGQVALSLVLLIGAGLLLRSLSQVQRVEPGFDATHLLTAQVPLPESKYPARADAERFWANFLARVRALPGVSAAAGTGLLPMRGFGDTFYYVEGHPPLSDADKRNAFVTVVTDDYFHTMRIPIHIGRAVGRADRAAMDENAGGRRQGTVVISHRMAERLFPHENPLGKRLVVDYGHMEIVGVAGDVHIFGQESGAPDVIYFSQRQRGSFLPMSLVVRTEGDPGALAPVLRAVLHEVDPTVPLANIATMDEILHDSLADSYFRTRLLGAFALVALLLAVVGLYGVLAYAVRQRTREIGVRIALGARAQDIVRSVVVRGMLLVGLGIVIGVAGALGTTRLIAGFLFDVGNADPLVFATVSGIMLVAGLLACLVPARRALGIDPTSALKEE